VTRRTATAVVVAVMLAIPACHPYMRGYARAHWTRIAPTSVVDQVRSRQYNYGESYWQVPDRLFDRLAAQAKRAGMTIPQFIHVSVEGSISYEEEQE